MLKPKQGICISCPLGSPPRFLIAKRCATHYWEHRRQISGKKSAARKAPGESESVGQWFEYHKETCSWVCENCGSPMNPFSPEVASSCQAHILPKEYFKSVQSVIENHMVLGGRGQVCSCHREYDSSWERAQGMSVWTLATERFQKFMHLIDPSEYKRLPDPFYKLIYAQ